MIRLNQLALTNIGGFDNRTFDFDQSAQVHVLLGPNEAGKSTLRRALANLLFGFPRSPQDRDAYRFGRNQVIGATFDWRGESLSLERRPGIKATLTGAETLPAFAGTAQSFSGLSRAQFEDLQGLDLAGLRDGGARILSGEGNLGGALFAVGTGVRSVETQLAQLEKQCAALFAPRAKNAVIPDLLDRLKQAEAALRQAVLSHDQDRNFQDALASLEIEISDLAQQRQDLADARQAADAQALFTSQLVGLAGERQNATALLDQAKATRQEQAAKIFVAGSQQPDPGTLALLSKALSDCAERLSQADKERAILLQRVEQNNDDLGEEDLVDLSALKALSDPKPLIERADDQRLRTKRLTEQLQADLATWALSLDDLRRSPPSEMQISKIITELTEQSDSKRNLLTRRAEAEERIAQLETALATDAKTQNVQTLLDARDNARKQRDELLKVSPPALAEIRAEIVRADQAADALLTQATEVERLATQKVSLAREWELQGKRQAKIAKCEQQIDDLRSAWMALWQTSGLPEVGSRDATKFIAEFKTLQARQSELHIAEDSLKRADNLIVEYLDQARAALPERAPSGLAATIAANDLSGFRQELSSYFEIQAQRKRLREESARDEAKIDSLTDQIKTGLAEWYELADGLSLLPVPNQAIAQILNADLAEYLKRQDRCGQAEESLARLDRQIADLEAKCTNVDTNLDAPDPAQAAEIEQRYRALVEDRTQRLATYNQRLSDGEAARLRAEIATMEKQLQQALDRFATLTAARDMLKDALERYRIAASDEVVANASRHFQQLTGGRYQSLSLSREADGAWTVINQDGEPVDLGDLSEGTGDQLFLALRLAFLDAQAADQRLPLIFDDILMSSDDSRAQAAFSCFNGLADRQVLYFTHHPHVAEMAAQGAGAQVIKI